MNDNTTNRLTIIRSHLRMDCRKLCMPRSRKNVLLPSRLLARMHLSASGCSQSGRSRSRCVPGLLSQSGCSHTTSQSADAGGKGTPVIVISIATECHRQSHQRHRIRHLAVPQQLQDVTSPLEPSRASSACKPETGSRQLHAQPHSTRDNLT